MRIGTIINKIINSTLYNMHQELNNYCEYILRCMLRVGIIVHPKDIAYVTFDMQDNTKFCQAIIYPAESVVDGVGIVNLLFFYAGIIQINDDGIVYTKYTESVEELESWR